MADALAELTGSDPTNAGHWTTLPEPFLVQKPSVNIYGTGHNAFFRKEKSPDKEGIQYQIYIEKYDTRDEAEKEARVLQDLELISDYTVKEVKETPQLFPDGINPADENMPEVLPVPQPAKVKEQPLKPKSETGQQTTAKKPSSEINKIEEKPAPKLQQKPKPKKRIRKPEPVINHDDARLTEASLQVGSFKDEANAAALKAKLKNLGKNAFYRHESTGNKGDFFRIYITGYASLGEAIKDAKELLNSSIITGYSRIIGKGSVSVIPQKTVDKKEKVYFIHISSNKDETNAVKNVASLKKSGYKAFYVLEKDAADSWYRVYIGEFKDETEARKKGMELLDKKLIEYFKPLAIDRKKLDN